eukprot:6201507-Pleurochrysis_carterae.AAC.2
MQRWQSCIRIQAQKPLSMPFSVDGVFRFEPVESLVISRRALRILRAAFGDGLMLPRRIVVVKRPTRAVGCSGRTAHPKERDVPADTQRDDDC